MFITNDTSANSLSETIIKKLPFCDELDILVGFFYFSGMQEIINSTRQNNNQKIKILVGLKADIINNKIVEYADYSEDIKKY